MYGIRNEEEYVKIATLSQIGNKETEFKLGKVVSNSMRRYTKYLNRGFKFTNSNFADLFHSICSTSRVYTVFRVKRIKDNEYQVLQGDLDKINEVIDCYSPGTDDGPSLLYNCNVVDRTIQIPKDTFYQLNCDERVACPVKFCFGDLNHFHIDDRQGLTIKTEFIFVDDENFELIKH